MALALAPSPPKSRRRPRLRRIALDPGEAADAASLRYVSDARPGIQRIRHGRAFRYVNGNGEAVEDLPTLRRIRSLAIPPAWTQVWICPAAHGHIQAVGRDARGRKQYRYHARWRAVRDETKYEKMVAFARALPKIRARVAADLARQERPRARDRCPRPLSRAHRAPHPGFAWRGAFPLPRRGGRAPDRRVRR